MSATPPARPLTVPRLDPAVSVPLALYQALWSQTQQGTVEPPALLVGTDSDPLEVVLVPVVIGDSPHVCLMASQDGSEACAALSADHVATVIAALQDALARARAAAAHPLPTPEELQDPHAPPP